MTEKCRRYPKKRPGSPIDQKEQAHRHPICYRGIPPLMQPELECHLPQLVFVPKGVEVKRSVIVWGKSKSQRNRFQSGFHKQKVRGQTRQSVSGSRAQTVGDRQEWTLPASPFQRIGAFCAKCQPWCRERQSAPRLLIIPMKPFACTRNAHRSNRHSREADTLTRPFILLLSIIILLLRVIQSH